MQAHFLAGLLSSFGLIVAGLVYNPVTEELFIAEKGKGAFLNDRRIRVSKRTQLKESLVSTGFPFRPGDNFNIYLRMMADVMKRTAGLRRPGAAALDLADEATERALVVPCANAPVDLMLVRDQVDLDYRDDVLPEASVKLLNAPFW